MKSLTKGLSALVLLLVTVVGLAVPAMAWTAAPTLANVEVNGVDVSSTTLDVERGEKLEIKFEVENTATDNPATPDVVEGGLVEELEISARLVGYEYDDETSVDSIVFDMPAGSTKEKTLSLTIPSDFTEEDAVLAIRLEDENADNYVYKYNLHVSGKRHDLNLDRVIMTPSNSVKAGSFLIVKARVENLGERDEEDVVFSAAIEGLEGMADAADFMSLDLGTIDVSEKETTEELYLGVPLCAKAGDYKVVTKLLYNNDKSEIVKTFPIKVVESESEVCAPKAPVAPKVTMPLAEQTVKAGQSLVLPVTITNAGAEAKNYVVSVAAGDLGAVRYAPANTVTVAADSTETLYVYVDSAADAAGVKVLGLSVKSGSDVVKEATLNVKVEGAESSLNLNTLGLRKVLEIGLVVLIVLIVLVGLIIGFNKLKDDDEDSEEDKTYY